MIYEVFSSVGQIVRIVFSYDIKYTTIGTLLDETNSTSNLREEGERREGGTHCSHPILSPQ